MNASTALRHGSKRRAAAHAVVRKAREYRLRCEKCDQAFHASEGLIARGFDPSKLHPSVWLR